MNVGSLHQVSKQLALKALTTKALTWSPKCSWGQLGTGCGLQLWEKSTEPHSVRALKANGCRPKVAT